MTELEILQQRFKDMSQQFPSLVHVLSVYPNNTKEPDPGSNYMPTQENTIAIWGDGLVSEYAPHKRMKHWLVKAKHTSWNKDQASAYFQDFAQIAGQMLIEKEFLSLLNLSRCIVELSECQLSHEQAAQLWVLVVHELGKTQKHVCDWRDSKANLSHKLNLDDSVPVLKYGYYEVQNDFFFNSFQITQQLIKLENEQKSHTRHSSDFRSVHWFGVDHSFTAIQAAIVKQLWDAWKNGTPEIGQETLLENSGSESKRLVDVFKGHKTYKQMIGHGNTKSSFQLNPSSNK